jgi:methionyl-tRNA synthetase
MGLEEHTIDDALPRHCEVCGATLTPNELQTARETGEPFLCTIHAAEELPLEDGSPLAEDG